MTKADLIEEVSKLSSLTKMRGFGSFRIRHRNSRKGRNPKTGDSVSVPEKRVPFFKVGKRLRELVNT
ncbi:MAG: integration host factor subunit beta [Candidatus Rokuibacteriota bacterium]|nr:MAG: integration host factor subunit beta [Candidatus Rokubacteria bacterium]